MVGWPARAGAQHCGCRKCATCPWQCCLSQSGAPTLVSWFETPGSLIVQTNGIESLQDAARVAVLQIVRSARSGAGPAALGENDYWSCDSCENVFSVGRLAPPLDSSDGDHSDTDSPMDSGSWLCPPCVAADSQPGPSHNRVRAQHTGRTWLEVLRRLESESGAYGPCSCHDSELNRRMRVMFGTAAPADRVDDVRKPHRSRAPAPRVAI